MSLLFPAYLAGLFGLALPWLLHRFSDQQPEEQLFPSRRFLEPTTPPVSRTRRLKYLLLLALRVASILLLCFLFAQPWIARQGSAGTARMHHLVAVDQSLSMRTTGQWDAALSEARSIIDEIPESDTIELVGFDNTLHRLATDEVSVDDLTQALASLQPGYTAADYGVLMQRLNNLAADQDMPVKLWLVTDEQNSSLPGQLNALYAPAVDTLEIRPVGGDSQRNVHLAATASSSDGVNVQLSAQVMVSVSERADGENSDARQPSDVTVLVTAGDQLLGEQQMRVQPGELETFVFDQLVLPASSNPILTVSLQEQDDLIEDDSVSVVVRSANPTPVVLLQSERDVSANAAVYLATALETDSQAVVETLAGTAERVPPDTRHITTGRSLEGSIALDVLQFVDGDNNALVFRSDASPVSGNRSVQGSEVGLVDEAHPLSLGDIDWYGTRFFDVAPMELDDTDRVLLQTTERQPVLVERQTARGRLLLLNDRLDGMGSNLPLQPAFVSLMQSVLRYFDASTALPDQVTVGNRLNLPANVQVLDPDGEPMLTLDASGRAGSIELNEPGLYKVLAARGEHPLRVVIDAREADITRMPAAARDAWQSRYGSGDGTGPESADNAPRLPSIDPVLLAQGADAARQSLWIIVLPLLVIALLLESWFANRRLDVRRDGS